MAAEDGGTGKTAPKGFLDSLKALLSTFVNLLEIRLDLISTEVEEEQERLKGAVFLGAIAFFCAGLGVVLLTLFVVAIFPEPHRLYLLGGFALLYLALGLLAGLCLRKKARSKPKLFSATLSELTKDCERMKS